MKIIAFKVHERSDISLDNVLNYIKMLPYEERFYRTSNGNVRLEKAVRSQSGNWHLDFTKIRTSGPGKTPLAAPIEDFELNDGDGFGEETAVYYDKELSVIIMQYNHYGPRAPSISSYLYAFSRKISKKPVNIDKNEEKDGFNLIPIMKPDARDKLQHMKLARSMVFSIHIPGINTDEINQNQSLGKILDNPLVAQAETLKVEIKASKKRDASLPLSLIKDAVRSLLGERANLTELKIVAREDEEAPAAPIDFLEARLQADVPLVLHGAQRYPLEERWEALQRTFQSWRERELLR